MNSTTAISTTDVLNQIFYRYGFPKEIVSDNGPPFSSHEFRRFCEEKGIKHSFSPPYVPHCNGLAERMVDTFKRQAKKNSQSNRNWISDFLFSYRTTPSQVLNGLSPAELCLGRQPRTPLSILAQSFRSEPVHQNAYQRKMKEQYDHHHGVADRKFKIGEMVLTLNYGRFNKPSWLEGKIIGGKGLIWQVQIPSLGITVNRHSNQMRNFFPKIPVLQENEDTEQVQEADQTEITHVPTPPRQQVLPAEPRPQRNRKPPKKLVMDPKAGGRYELQE